MNAHSNRILLVLMVAAAGVGPAPARTSAETAVLPPELPWSGKSLEIPLPPGDPWATPAEKASLLRTPRYDETVAWLRRLADASPEVELVSLGRSPEGRDLWMAIASADRAFTPRALRESGKPVMLAQAGIHAGEIDGKDAGMMLLRDLTVRGTRRALLQKATFLFVPIFNVDGHERFSSFTRINQRGPEEAGWRTTARNLNLNRDYGKLDTPEMRAMVAAIEAWAPDLYLDLHVTDGADYQYDVTWGYHARQGYSPATGAWLEEAFTPAVKRELTDWGHIPGPLIFFDDAHHPERGTFEWTSGPRFSTGYGDLRHLATVLVENHSLKPYPQRVLGMYVLLDSALRTLGEHGAELRQAAAADRARRPAEIPLDWVASTGPPPILDLLGVESRLVPSEITGGERQEYTGKPVTFRVPQLRLDTPGHTARRPQAYLIPPAWGEVIARLEQHGIRMERLGGAITREVEMYRIADAALESQPTEGHARVEGKVTLERRQESFPAGTVRIATDQPLGDLAAILLEPESPDSFFRWGFFLEALERTEYVEDYVMDPMAARMLAADPELAKEFRARLAADPKFAADPAERLQWFYRRTPYFDDRAGLYPIAREP
jgi:murein tripeptide amidase MpaA